MISLAVVNQKGGVGKTTTAINLCAAISEKNFKVLLIDLDPQGNSTMGSGVEKNQIKSTIYDVLIGEKEIDDILIFSENSKFFIAPSNKNLAGAEVELVDLENREYQLKNAIRRSKKVFDFIVIDCPPSLNLLTINALAFVNKVLIPMQCEYYALEGLSDLVNTIKVVKQRMNSEIEIEGLIRTMFDSRNTLTNQVSDQLENHFAEKVYKAIIPRNVRLAEAPSHGLPAIFFDGVSKGASAYRELAMEFLSRNKKVKEK